MDIGTGATIAFATSSFTAQIVSMDVSGITRVAIPSSHLGTTSAHTFLRGDLYDPGSLDLEIFHDPAKYPPFSGAAETITITFPISTTHTTNGGTFAASGFVTDVGFSVPLEDSMKSGITVKFSGAITTAGPS